MKINDLQKNWDEFGKKDPLWSILSFPEKKRGKWKTKEFFETGKKEIDSVIDYMKPFQTKKIHSVLDFGCGVGRLTQALGMHFKKVYGVDIAPSMIDLARKFNQRGDTCEYILNQKETLDFFKDGTVDFIYTNITLQHIHPRYSKKYIQEFLRILSPEGILIFQIPSEKKLPESIKEILKVRGKKIIPRKIKKWYHGAEMEMYGIPRKEVIQFTEKNKGIIIDIQEDQRAGSEWESYRYCVTKK